MKKLLLINPSSSLRKEGLGQRAWQATPPLALGYIAALTGPAWDVKIVDEYIQSVDTSEPADLVGITSMTCNAPRAYALAEAFRARGIPVVLGGIHVSMCPEEAMNYGDAVVVGEAEAIWSTVLADAERRLLQRKYMGPRVPLDNLPRPRRDLYAKTYGIDLVLTTKGCPFNCSFCNVTVFNGLEYRRRPVDQVLDEIASIDRWLLYFVDDNLFGADRESKDRILRLFQGMIDRRLHKIWGAQASLNIADDPEVLDYAFKSGCRSLFIGIESIEPATLKEMNKGINLKRGMAGLRKAVDRIHKSGISVCGGFIFGSDHDDRGVFKRTLEFIQEAGVDAVGVSFLTPYPGTRLYERLLQENRIIYRDYPEDWDRYDQSHIVFKPLKCDISELVRAVDRVDAHRLSSKPELIRRAIGTWIKTGSLASARFAYGINAGTKA